MNRIYSYLCCCFGGHHHGYYNYHHPQYHNHHHHNHHNHHHCYPHVVRLRPALYFFLTLVLSTFLYCLVFYDQPNGLIRSTISFHHHHHHSHHHNRHHHISNSFQSSNRKQLNDGGVEDNDDDDYDDTLIQSEIKLFDQLMRNANRHFIDSFRRKIVQEEQENLNLNDSNDGDRSDDVVISNIVPIEHSSSSSSSHEMSDKLHYDYVPDHHNHHNNNNNNNSDSLSTNSSFDDSNVGDNEEEVPEQEEEEEPEEVEEESYDRNRIEHNLRLLGIDLRHIIEINRSNHHLHHNLHNNNNNNRSNFNNNNDNNLLLIDSLSSSKFNKINNNQKNQVIFNNNSSSSSTFKSTNSSKFQSHSNSNHHHHHKHYRNQYHQDLPEYFLVDPNFEFEENVNVNRIEHSVTFVSAINYNQFNIGFDFIKSFEKFRILSTIGPNSTTKNNNMLINLLIYDLGLYPNQLFEIETLCNSTGTIAGEKSQSISQIFNISSTFMTTSPTLTSPASSSPLSSSPLCVIRRFNYDQYPSHISNLKIAAYRPLIIQEVLRDLKHLKYRLESEEQLGPTTAKNKRKRFFAPISVLWFDIHYRFIPSRYEKLAQLLNQTGFQSGVASWPIEQPTSSLTDPRMFEYFETSADNYYFHRMIRSGHLLLSLRDSTWPQIEWGIMLPWVRCALSADCIAPFGSQWRSVCQLDKKPHYRYSGCHHYDMSALNVILGIAFNYSSSIYSASNSDRFFISFNHLLFKPQQSQQQQQDSGHRIVLSPPPSSSSSSSHQHRFSSRYYNRIRQSKDFIGKDEIISLFQQPPQQQSDDLLGNNLGNNRKIRASLSSSSGSSLDSEEHYRFDRILTDDDLPSELRRTSFLLNPLLYESSSSISILDINGEENGKA